MSSLSDKLKSLGVKVGASEIPTPPSRPKTGSMLELEQELSGHTLATPLGETFIVEEHYPTGQPYGRSRIELSAPRKAIAAWARENRIRDFSPDSFAFLDTETTGLSGGTGTYAFLIGVGRFEGEDFHLAQFFMRDPAEEPAQLAALEQFIAPCNALVTFNGKAFDVPLLNTRFITQGWRSPFADTAHVDLLHLARRLWRDRLASRTLGNLEVQILGASRTEEDVPGWMIPSLYFDYLRSGDVAPLKRVFYHNGVDVVSMAALFNHMAGLLADPLNGDIEHGVDLVALGKLFEDMGDIELATRLYVRGLDYDLPKPALLDAIQHLAMIHKRQENHLEALSLWEQAARYKHVQAHIELAKYYEHRARDYPAAIEWTQSAIELVSQPDFSSFDRSQWLPELQHRLERLLAKRQAAFPVGDDIIPPAEK
jgi:uncharacterized protein YprB with RNaseH-like and TPR domain